MENRNLARIRHGWPTLLGDDWIDKFFSSPLDEFFTTRTVSVPAVNVTENEKDYVLTLAAPGLKKDDFKLEVDDDVMTIKAEKEKEEKEEKNGRYNRREYNYTSWSRSFALPENGRGGKINAEYKNGELVITVPKTQVKETKNVKSIEIH